MVKTSTFINFLNFSCLQDPLEQFETITPFDLPAFFGLTNLSINLALVTAVAYLLFFTLNTKVQTVLDSFILQFFSLVRTLVKENLYVQKQQYFTVILYLFSILFLANVSGLAPFSFTITSAFIVTVTLALMHFLGANIVGVNRHSWTLFDLFLPSGAPLIIAPFLIVIEAVSYYARVLSLSIRLFANMMSGHALLKILIGFAWALLCTITVFTPLALLPWSVVTAVFFLELLIAFLQAYVFSILVTLYINDVITLHD